MEIYDLISSLGKITMSIKVVRMPLDPKVPNVVTKRGEKVRYRSTEGRSS